MFTPSFFKKRRIFVTGHTGFKGSWLCLWLNSLGAQVTGYALKPPTKPSLFEICRIDRLVRSVIADIRDLGRLKKTLLEAKPEIVIHMAAQPLVLDSYKDPVETYAVNLMGTVNLLETVRHCESVRAVINITSDKCYENREWCWGYRETDPMGGFDPYSNSKGCSELVTSAYRNSYFNPARYHAHKTAVASARAGNVIGGGDWAQNRLVPDFVRAVLKKQKLIIRNPKAIRPWQHVLEPLCGYLTLAEKLCSQGAGFAEAWNFGPDQEDEKPVSWIIDRLCAKWGPEASYKVVQAAKLHEAAYLKLDCSKARARLGWRPRWNLDSALDKVVEWTQAYKRREDMVTVCLNQIQEYCL